MTYSFTQISQYLRCPRRYRYRYLDGWREKEDKASLIFGRCFENALAAYFRRKDATATFFKEWQKQQDSPLAYTKNDSWDRLYHQGVHLLERFAQDDRVQIRRPNQNLQVKLTRVCYSWMSGISDVALVVFVRKNASEVQYLKTSIDEHQRREFGELVEATVTQIEAGQFLPHSGIRFPQNGCVSCSHLGLCLGDQQLVDSKLIRRPGAP